MKHAVTDADIDRFVAHLRTRLAAGAVTYGDTSFTRPAAELVDEVMQELEDTAGWSVLVAGKGHANEQIVGNQRLPFSDRNELERAIVEQRGAEARG